MLRPAPFVSLPLLLVGCLLGCVVPGEPSASARAGDEDLRVWTYVPDLPISPPPYEEVHASWKQRLDVPYVFLDHEGSYAETGALIPVLHREMRAQGLEPDGPPFCLFYDDPAGVPTAELRSRACIPVRGPRSILAPLRYEVLRSTTVGYAFVSGPYPDAPRAYPGVFAYLDRMGWVPDGPIREIYLVPPGAEPDARELVCEIQIPARAE